MRFRTMPSLTYGRDLVVEIVLILLKINDNVIFFTFIDFILIDIFKPSHQPI
jgi:hypothetical protein